MNKNLNNFILLRIIPAFFYKFVHLIHKDTEGLTTQIHCGEPLKNLTLKKNILIVCITHRGKFEIPNGESSYEVGDTVIVVSNGDEVIYQLNAIFEA